LEPLCAILLAIIFGQTNAEIKWPVTRFCPDGSAQKKELSLKIGTPFGEVPVSVVVPVFFYFN